VHGSGGGGVCGGGGGGAQGKAIRMSVAAVTMIVGTFIGHPTFIRRRRTLSNRVKPPHGVLNNRPEVASQCSLSEAHQDPSGGGGVQPSGGLVFPNHWTTAQTGGGSKSSTPNPPVDANAQSFKNKGLTF